MWVHPTVTASTIIARFDFGRKVRCHKGAVENFGSGEFPVNWCGRMKSKAPPKRSLDGAAPTRPKVYR
jgi:hypothetical protein